MASNWTKEQLDAITERGCNLLVAAAAGAGKTAVLVERIIRKITDPENPVDIDRLLVVTFTNAAATEMRERIGDALAEALEKDPSSANLQRQMALLDRASIMTIHSFCLEVVRSNFHALDLDPLFRIADETESALMRLEALDRLFESKYENEDNDSLFFRLVESYGGGRDDCLLRDTVMTLHHFTCSHPYPEKWLAEQAEAFNIGDSACVCGTPWARVLLDSAAAELQGLIGMLGKAAEKARQAEGLEPYCGVLEDDRKVLENLLSLSLDAMGKADDGYDCEADLAWDRLYNAFASLEFARLPRLGKDADKTVQEEIKTVRNTVKERVKKLHAGGFDISCAEIRDDFCKLYPQLRYLSDMVLEFDEIYRRMKKEKGVLDFNDLEHYCLQILLENGVPTAAAKELRKRYEEILVDEYQDSNLIQEIIISAVSGNDDGINNIFMVGDVKQSIYRFRQARPDLFLSKYRTWHRERGHEDRVIQLYKNFRSRREVINTVNFIFRQIMSPEVGELDYTEQEYLNPGAFFPAPVHDCITGGSVELHILDLSSEANEIIPYGTGRQDDTAEGNGAAETQPDGTGKPEGQTGATGEPDAKAAGKAGTDASSCDSKVNSEASRSNAQTGGTGNNVDTSRDRGDGGSAEDGVMEEDDEERLDSIQYEARLVGNIIRRIVTHEPGGFNVYDKKMGTYRPVEYRDIVILMRTTMNWADVFVDELALMGIPAYADTGLGYFRTVEVETMLSLLQIIDNPLQDIPMLAVLRSPIGGFSTDDLADIRLADRSVSIYEAMRKLAGFADGDELHDADRPDDAGKGKTCGTKTGSVCTYDTKADDSETDDAEACGISNLTGAGADIYDVRRKTRDFLARLDKWRDAAQYMPVDELVWQLLTETGYYSYVGALPGGAERKANLRMLFERARQYEETSYRGLFNFISFINRLRSGGGDMGSAKMLGENDNVVRIMSIHKSKGLEFPVVIVSGCGKRFNMQDLNASILLHQDLGFGPDLVDLEKRTIIPSLPKFAIRQKLRLETLSEEMRILYVAFTRAREKLIITGSVRDHAAALDSWREKAAGGEDKLSPYEMMQASSYLDWIGPAVVKCGIAGPRGRACGAGETTGADGTSGADSAGTCRTSRPGTGETDGPGICETGGVGKLLPETREDADHIHGKETVDTCPENTGENLADEPLLEIRFWGTGAAQLEKGTPEAAENVREWLQDESVRDEGSPETPGAEQAEVQRIIDALEWTYPYKKLTTVPAKISVTELKRRALQEEAPESAVPYMQPMQERPLFMEPDKGLSAAHKGTVMHFVMQHLDLGRLFEVTEQANCPGSGSGTDQADGLVREISSQVASMTERELLTHAEAASVDPDAVAEFFRSPFGKRMLSVHDSVHRETAFTIEIKCSEVLKLPKPGLQPEGMEDLPQDVDCDETMLLQGVIDCWFETENGLVLLDYKTDYVPAGRSDIIRERYKVQMDYYTKALEKITGRKVTERYLYLFFSGELLDC